MSSDILKSTLLKPLPLVSTFGFFGINDVRFVRAEGVAMGEANYSGCGKPVGYPTHPRQTRDKLTTS